MPNSLPTLAAVVRQFMQITGVHRNDCRHQTSQRHLQCARMPSVEDACTTGTDTHRIYIEDAYQVTVFGLLAMYEYAPDR